MLFVECYSAWAVRMGRSVGARHGGTAWTSSDHDSALVHSQPFKLGRINTASKAAEAKP